MSLTEETARKIVNALEHAAHAAKEQAKAEESKAYMALAHPPLPLPPGDTLVAFNARQHFRCEAAKRAQKSIVANAQVLEGLVLLAAREQTKGLNLLEVGTGTSYVNLGHPDPRETEVYLAHQAFVHQDIPALEDYHKVKPGIFDRVFKGTIKYSFGAPYSADMIGIYEHVKDDVAEALEIEAVTR